MYKDEIEKIKYYVKKIIDLEAMNGKVLSSDEINKAIDEIDTRLAIFKQAFIDTGETLDLEKFNEQKVDIYEDLKILYRLVYETAEKRMMLLEDKIKYQLEEMYAETNKYKQRNQIETLSIYGKTLFFQTSGFNQMYENGNIVIRLGELDIPAGSYIACLLNCPEADSKDIYFQFDDKLKTTDFRANRSFLKIQGSYEINTHMYKSNELYSKGFEVPVSVNPKKTNTYTLYAGENKIKVFYPQYGRTTYYEKKPGIAFKADEDCEISFYVYGSTSINFDMTSEKCLYKSFNEDLINAPKHREKIVIRCESGFILDFVTDGKIFADKGRCYIKEDKIYSEGGFSELNSYLLEEIAYGPDVHFNDVKIIIKNAKELFYDIESVAIKFAQISELDGEIEV